MKEQEIITFKEKLIREGRKGLVLDIDETLSWTVGHWVEQLQKQFGNPENLTPKGIVAKYKYTQLVPYWQSTEALEWMENARNDNSIQEELPLIENANHVVQRINEIIPIVGYLTIRPKTVLEGTKVWLRKHDFPQEEILARPSHIPTSDGNQWKANILHYLYPQVSGIIDDNPAVVQNLPADYRGIIYLFDSEESVRGDITVIPCKTWPDVHANVQLLHGA